MTSALEAAGAADRFAVVDETGGAPPNCAATSTRGCRWCSGPPSTFSRCRGWTGGGCPNGRMFDWKLNEHCLLLVGYDQDRYWFNDPWHNHGLCAQPKELVEECHRAQDSVRCGAAPANDRRPGPKRNPPPSCPGKRGLDRWIS